MHGARLRLLSLYEQFGVRRSGLSSPLSEHTELGWALSAERATIPESTELTVVTEA